MKIAHIFWSLTVGGIETMLVNLANEQAKAGHDVFVILVNKFYEQILVETLGSNVTFMCMGRKPNSRSLNFLYKLNKTLCDLQPDVIHLHNSRLYGLLLNKKLSRVACSTLHALPRGAVRRGLLGRIPLWNSMRNSAIVCLIDKVPKVFSISQVVHDKLLEKYGVESVVVNNGVITKNFKQRNLDTPKELFRIVQVSRLEHDKKGQDLLIRAVAKLQDAKVSVDFIGEGSSMEYLKILSEELNIVDQINFLGKCPQNYITEHLRDYDLFVQPSRYEGFGLTVAEAMTARVPVLTSAGQGPAEVCCNNIYGWIFENGSAEDLANKIAYIYNNYNEALRKAESAQQYVSETYDISVTARNYLENYRKY